MAQIYSSQLCECGCGQIANSTDRRLSRRRRFIYGHQVRTRGRKPRTIPPNNTTLCGCGCGKPLITQRRFLKGHNSRLAHHGKAIDVQPNDPRGPNPSGLCLCQCGRQTTVATYNSKGLMKGCYARYIKGHAMTPSVRRIGNLSGGLCMCGCGLETPIATQNRLGNIAGTPQMYFPGHRWQHQYVVNRRTGCWELPPDKVHGYGRIRRDGRLWLAHRWYWEQRFGPIPDDMTLDHLCRVRNCCNPDHMEICTQEENSRRVWNHPEIPKWGDWDESDIVIDPETQCWLFPIVQQDGYARFWKGNRLVPAHRFYYQREKGRIPAGLQLDHLCRRRNCVCPSHLEPVTRIENLRRAAAAKLAATA